MAKLIHSEKLEYVKKNSSLYDSNASGMKYKGDALNGVIFTDDGYIIAKGHPYYIGNSAPGTGTAGITINNGQITVIDNNGNQIGQATTLPVYNASDGLKLESGTVKHSTSRGTTSFNGISLSNYNINTSTISLDSYGHATGYNAPSGDGVQLDRITDAIMEASKTYYLLGGENSTANSTYYNPLKSAQLSVKLDANSNATLYVGTTNTAANKVITAGDIGNLTGAMRYKGATNSSNSGWSTNGNGPASHKVGDVWYVAAAGTYAGHVCEVGDMLICKTDSVANATAGVAADWTAVQNNWTASVPTTVPTIGTSDTTLATIGGVTIKAKVAADNNTWRQIFVGSDTAAKLESDSTGTNALPLKFVDGTNITATWNATNKTLQFDYTGTPTDSTYTLITATSNNTNSENTTDSANTTTYLNLLESVSGAAKTVADSIQITGSGDTTVKSKNGIITINSTHTDPTYSFSSLEFSGNGLSTAKSYVPGKNAASTGTNITKLVAGSNVSFGYTDNNKITISSANTWRDIQYYAIASSAQDGTIDNYYTTNSMTPADAGTRPLKFSSNFTFDSSNELDLVWAEVSSAGTVTYSV